MVEINPEDRLDNISWSWIKNTFKDIKGISKDESWLHISTDDRKIKDIFRRISRFPIIILDEASRMREFSKYSEGELVKLIIQLKAIFGHPGQIPNLNDVEYKNTGIEIKLEVKNPNKNIQQLIFYPTCPLCKSKLGKLLLPNVSGLGGKTVGCKDCGQQVSCRYSSKENLLYVSMHTIANDMSNPGEIKFKPAAK